MDAVDQCQSQSTLNISEKISKAQHLLLYLCWTVPKKLERGTSPCCSGGVRAYVARIWYCVAHVVLLLRALQAEGASDLEREMSRVLFLAQCLLLLLSARNGLAWTCQMSIVGGVSETSAYQECSIQCTPAANEVHDKLTAWAHASLSTCQQTSGAFALCCTCIFDSVSRRVTAALRQHTAQRCNTRLVCFDNLLLLKAQSKISKRVLTAIRL